MLISSRFGFRVALASMAVAAEWELVEQFTFRVVN
jgi:hypothetical protein